MYLCTPPITITRVGILAGPKRDSMRVYHSLSFAIRTKCMLLEYNTL